MGFHAAGEDRCAEDTFRRLHIPEGGTSIAKQGKAETQDRYRPGEVGADLLLHAVSSLQTSATIISEQVAQMASRDIGGAAWIQVAKYINALFAADAAGGVLSVRAKSCGRSIRMRNRNSTWKNFVGQRLGEVPSFHDRGRRNRQTRTQYCARSMHKRRRRNRGRSGRSPGVYRRIRARFALSKT